MDRLIKRSVDIVVSCICLVIFTPVIFVCIVILALETKMSGIFSQERIGKNGKTFRIYKIRTMRNVPGFSSSVTSDKDPRITKFGFLLRKMKLDELPQLLNVLKGDMSFVGPRPDVPGFADKLTGVDRIILSVCPGITGPAQIHFKNEEALLANQKDPEKYNRDVIWPKKVRINRKYVNNWNLFKDIYYLYKTFFNHYE